MFRPRNGCVAAGALAVLILSACRKDRPDPVWDLDMTVPLAKTSLTLGDLLPDSILQSDTAGGVSILYTANLFKLSLDTVLTAPDTTFRYAYAIPFPGPIQFAPGSAFESSDDVTHFDLEDLELTKLIIRTGQLDFSVTNMMNGNIVGDFAIPGASLDGQSFSMELILPPGTPAAPSSLSASRALDGYEFDLRGPDQNSVNALATQLTYMNAPWGAPVNITDQDSLLAYVAYHDIVPEYAKGSFGTRVFTVDPDTAGIDLFANITGTIDLAQAEARLKVRNGLGVDAQAHLHFIHSINTRNGTTVDLTGPLTTGPVNITRATDLGNGFQPTQTTSELNQGNSNIEQFLENLPNRIGYALDFTINPMGDISNGHDFLYHDSEINADLEVEIPLRLIATDLVLQKAMELDLPGTSTSHAWRSGTLHLFAENGFPFSAQVELAVVDASGQVLASLGPGGTIGAGSLGTNLFVTSPSSARIDFPIGTEQMDLIHQTGLVRVRATFNTAEQSQHIQLLAHYRMDLQLTVDANYAVNGDE